MAFDPSTQTARIDFAETRRAFRIERKGLLKSKIVMKNEYGVNISQLDFEAAGANKGYIHLDDKRFLYSVDESDKEQITIYHSETEQPLISCSLANRPAETSGRKNVVQAYSHLLMTLCWFLFAPGKTEKEVMEFGL